MEKAPTRVHMWISSSLKGENQSLKVEIIREGVQQQQDGDIPQLSVTDCTTDPSCGLCTAEKKKMGMEWIK